MSRLKIEKDLARVREQIKCLQKREHNLVNELKMEEDAQKQMILDKHHISVEELTEMINAKKSEEKRLLAQARESEIQN